MGRRTSLTRPKESVIRHRRISVTAALAGTLLATFLSAPVRANDAYFNDLGANSQVLVDREVADIEGAPPGTEILVANPEMYRDYAIPLLDALQRGVEVHWVTLAHTYQKYPYGSVLADALNDTPGSSVTICEASCIDGPAMTSRGVYSSMHAKTMQLVYPDGSIRTEIGSNDWTPGVPEREYNSLVVTTDPTIGKATNQWLNCMLEQQGLSCYPKVVHSRHLTLVQFPNGQTSGTDNPFYRFLRPVSCAHGTRVQVLSAVWQRLMLPVAHRLAQLHERGCRVQIVASVRRTAPSIVKALTRAHLEVRWSGNPDPQEGNGPHNHTKEILISGTYQHHVTRAMLEGSYNMGSGAYSDNNVIEQARVSASHFAAAERHLLEEWRAASPTR